MKTATKFLVGTGVVAVIGATAATLFLSDKVIENVKEIKNRHKVKQFVSEKLDGNEQLLAVVDELADNELAAVVGIIAKVQAKKNKIEVSGKSVKEISQDVKTLLFQFVEQIL